MLFAVGVPQVYRRQFCGAADLLPAARSQAGFTQQSTGFTCTAASVSNLCRLHGLDVSERQAAELMRLNVWGGSVYQVAHALSQLGFTYEETAGNKIEDVVCPAILIVDWGAAADGHAILVTGRTGAEFTVVDPLGGGEHRRPAAWFAGSWRGKGVMNIQRAPKP